MRRQGARASEQVSDGGAASRRSFWCALACWTFSVSAMVISTAYSELNQLPKSAISFQSGPANGPVAVVFVVSFATVGALLAWKRPANAIGWLLSAVAVSFSCAGVGLLFAYDPGTLTLANWLGWIWLFGLGLNVPVLLIFPTGRLLSRRWRPVAWAVTAGLAAWVVGNILAPTIITAGPPAIRNPVGISGPAGNAFQVLAFGGALTLLGCGVAAIASLVIRYLRAQLIEREQLKWLVYVSAIIVVAAVTEAVLQNVLGSTAASTDLQNVTSSAAATLVPVAIGIAIFRYRLYDIDVVINKTLVYGSLAAFITGVYVAIVVGLGALLTDERTQPSLLLPIIATAVVAIAFQPVRERAQHLANLLVYGKRATPYEVLADFAARMAGTYATEEVLPRMARILADGTAAARADVWLASGSEFRDDASWPPDAPRLPRITATQAGDQLICPGTDRVLPVRYQGELLGALSVTKRPGESLTPTEGKLLVDLAAQVGLVLRNVGLWEELMARLEDIRASRRRLVAAQDAERRRIERNIHDGAQQQLVALAIKLSLAESMIGVDTAGEREMLGELRTDATAASQELWDLAHGIYPPLLVAEGLAAALSAQAAKSPVRTELETDGIGRYPHEVEAAAYFCVLEALQNVAKYSGATTAVVRISAASGDLEFEVADNGVGFDTTARAYGSGLQGIADRLGAHRGLLEVDSTPGDGTVIRGRLPRSALEPAA
jgi:signal transduction histidine kinase